MKRTVAATLFVLVGCNASNPMSGGGGPAARVIVGNTFFQSAHNSSDNPAVDTVTAGSTVTWAWNESGTAHGVQSTGFPIFRNSVVMSVRNATYSVTFKTPGTYTYQCAIHGSAMTGQIVVLPVRLP